MRPRLSPDGRTLVQMLGSLNDPSSIGPAMGLALLTTFYGAVLGNVVLVPLAAKLERTAGDIMTRGPVTIGPLTLAVEALKMLEERRISSLVVVEDDRVVGVLHLHDLWRTELF